MKDYLEQKGDQERESEEASEESRDKAAKDKATAEDRRNKAMERLSETRKEKEIQWKWHSRIFERGIR